MPGRRMAVAVAAAVTVLLGIVASVASIHARASAPFMVESVGTYNGGSMDLLSRNPPDQMVTVEHMLWAHTGSKHYQRVNGVWRLYAEEVDGAGFYEDLERLRALFGPASTTRVRFVSNGSYLASIGEVGGQEAIALVRTTCGCGFPGFFVPKSFESTRASIDGTGAVTPTGNWSVEAPDIDDFRVYTGESARSAASRAFGH